MNNHFTKKNITWTTLIIFIVNIVCFLADTIFYETGSKYVVLYYISSINYLFYYPFGFLLKHYLFPSAILESIPLLLLLLNSLFFAVIFLLAISYFKSLSKKKPQ